MRAGWSLLQALDPLGPAPVVSNDYVAAVLKQSPGGFGVMLNNSIGNCVCADSGHQVMIHTANAGTIIIPTDNDILALYEAVGGYNPADPSTDQGCDETAMCQYMESTGLCGQKSAGTAMVDPARIVHLKWSAQLFGACRLGITVTDDMMTAFGTGQPWTTYSGNVDGGHDVPIVKYDSEYAYVITWGQLQAVAWSLVADPKFLQESHAEVFPDFISAGGTAPNGFDLQALLADLQEVAATP
jgi:hypothetical protein